MTTLQEWLNEKYPTKEEREKVKEIYASYYGSEFYKKLEFEKAELDLSDFPNLEKLNVYQQKITVLNVRKCPKLTSLDCRENYLTALDLSNNNQLIKLFISYQEEEGQFVKNIIFPTDLSLNDFIWRLWENYSGRKGNRIGVNGIEKLTDFSDLDEWVQNYDVKQIGNREYHKFMCEESPGVFPDSGELDNLSNKIIARNLIIANRLADGIDKEYEDWVAGLGNQAGKCMAMNPKKGFTKEQYQEAVNKALNGNIELLSRLQNLPYLKPEFNFNKNPQLVLKEINQLKEELQTEREEITGFHQKSEEWSKRQLKELREEKDKEIAELKEKIVQLVNQQKKQTEEKKINTENQELQERLNVKVNAKRK